MNKIVSNTSIDLELSQSKLKKIKADNKSAEIVILESKLIQIRIFSKPESTRISYQTNIKKLFEFYINLTLGSNSSNCSILKKIRSKLCQIKISPK